MPEPMLRPPTPDDAEAWFDFLVAQQALTYRGIVPGDFAARQHDHRDDWVAGLVAKFSAPGTASRLVAVLDGELVGLASTVDGPADWEIDAGLVPAPAGRELSRLYVAPRFHGTGLAARMFDAIDDGSDLYLWLIDGNDRGRRFYLRRGFVDLDESFEAGDSWGGVAMQRMARIADQEGARQA